MRKQKHTLLYAYCANIRIKKPQKKEPDRIVHNPLYMDLKMSLKECQRRRIQHFVVVLIWFYNVGLIATDSYFTSNSDIFDSVPTTIKTNENDTVLLPCSPAGEFDYKITNTLFFSQTINFRQQKRGQVRHKFLFLDCTTISRFDLIY